MINTWCMAEALNDVVAQAIREVEIVRRMPELLSFLQNRDAGNALGDVTLSLVQAIERDEDEFRTLVGHIVQSRTDFENRRTKRNQQRYVTAVSKIAKWIANVRDIGNRHRPRPRLI